MAKNYYIYILANKRKAVLYVGVSNDLIKRVWQHKSKAVKGFTEKYNINTSFAFCHSVLDTESIQIIVEIDSRFRGNDMKLIL